MYLDKHNHNLTLSESERACLIRSIEYIIKEITDELPTRTGFCRKEYTSLMNKLREGVSLFTQTELLMLHQALNEICNGINVPNFESVIGISYSHAEEMFKLLEASIE